MTIKDMPHVTAEQVLALRKAAIKLEAERDMLMDAIENPTIEDGMKADCIGESSFTVEGRLACPECFDDEVDAECEVCNGFGAIDLNVVVPWGIQKDIYKAMSESRARIIRKQLLNAGGGA